MRVGIVPIWGLIPWDQPIKINSACIEPAGNELALTVALCTKGIRGVTVDLQQQNIKKLIVTCYREMQFLIGR